MPKAQELDLAYLDMAETWASLSKAKRKKVGCLIVKDGAIISDGYNGTPSGFDNDCEIRVPVENAEMTDDEGNWFGDYVPFKKFDLQTKPEVLHAESNAITKLAKSTQSSKGATMYITISPCMDCSKLIIQSGIKRVVYRKFYKNDEGIKLLKQGGIEVVSYEN